MGLHFLTHKITSNKMWIDGLVHEIQLMAHVSGMTSTPFRNWKFYHHFYNVSKKFLLGSVFNLWVAPCLQKHSYCGCFCHRLCMGLHLDNHVNACASPNCGKILSKEWITSVAFKRINMLLKMPKLEKLSPLIFTKTATTTTQWVQIH